jgi:hypothetical protein
MNTFPIRNTKLVTKLFRPFIVIDIQQEVRDNSRRFIQADVGTRDTSGRLFSCTLAAFSHLWHFLGSCILNVTFLVKMRRNFD